MEGEKARNAENALKFAWPLALRGSLFLLFNEKHLFRDRISENVYEFSHFSWEIVWGAFFEIC